ncbi:MAG: ABC transporter substrate-binding protein [Dehalococcoidia bacterium]
MRRLPIVLALLGLGAACAPSPTPVATGGVAPPAPAVPQNFVYATTQLPPTMDPAVVLGGVRRMDQFETLTVQDPTGKTTTGQLAKEWKLINDTTWEFTLREGSKFHDGSPVTAADVAFSANRALDPARRFTIISRIPSVTNSEATGPLTVRFTTRVADPILDKRLASLAILPKALVESQGEETFFKNPVGSGPFRFKEFVPDDRLTVTGWKDHPFRKPKLDTLTLKNVPEAAQRLNGLRAGEVDYATGLPLDQYERLKGEGFQIEVRNAGYSGSWGLDALKDSPLRDKRVRWAINYAIDKEAISKNIYAGLSPVEKGQVTQPEAFGFDPTLKPYDYDPAKAKALLAEAGYSNGFDIVADVWMASSEIQRLALFLQQQLRDIGIRVEIAGYPDVATFLDKGNGTKPRAPMYNGGPAIIPAMDAEQALTAYISTQPDPRRRLINAEFDAAIAAASKEMDKAKREKYLQDAAKILREEAPILFLVQQAGINGWSPKVKGLTPRIPDDVLFETVEKIG